MQPTGFASLRSACQRLMPTLGGFRKTGKRKPRELLVALRIGIERRAAQRMALTSNVAHKALGGSSLASAVAR